MNTKKLNAGIAFLCLQNIDNQGVIPENLLLQITNLANQSESTELYTTGTNEVEVIKQCIALIQDYLRSVSTDSNIEEGSHADRGISIGDRVEVLEDAPNDSTGNYYDKGEVGVVIRMLEESCIVDFWPGGFGTAEIPFSSLKKILE